MEYIFVPYRFWLMVTSNPASRMVSRSLAKRWANCLDESISKRKPKSRDTRLSATNNSRDKTFFRLPSSSRVPKVPKYQTRILPVAAIYGGNASGKTNFFKALSFVKGLVVRGTGPDSLIPVTLPVIEDLFAGAGDLNKLFVGDGFSGHSKAEFIDYFINQQLQFEARRLWMSFRDSVSFSMVASRERQHGDRVPKVPKYQTRILPVAAIYGGNASGKTNFFKALSFVKGLVVRGTELLM
jgi:hypothetical protein